MMSEYEESGMNRRGFLKVAAVTAVAAVAAGGGAAVLKSQSAGVTTIIPAPAAAIPPIAPARGVAAAAIDPTLPLRTQLAALQSENAQLQADLMAVQGRLEMETAVNGGTVNANDALHLELGNANGRISAMAGLIALYEQLDGIDVGTVVEDGLTAVTKQFDALTAALPDLDDSIVAGRLALDELEAHIPLLENGRAWLDFQQKKLSNYFDGVEQVLKTAVDSVGPFLQMFNEWVQNMLKWLPFGLGEKTSAISAAITELLLETPATVSGLDTNIAQPLDVWLGAENEEAPLRGTLIKPMRDGVLAKSTAVIAQIEQARGGYEVELRDKLKTAVSTQRTIQVAIAQYRGINGV